MSNHGGVGQSSLWAGNRAWIFIKMFQIVGPVLTVLSHIVGIENAVEDRPKRFKVLTFQQVCV